MHILHKYIQENGIDKTIQELDTLSEQGYIYRKQKNHLVLYKYTQQCVAERNWNTLTRSSRGIVYNIATNRFSYTMSKFFNHLEETSIIPPGEFQVFDKVDGSLIHFFYDYADNCWRCCTPGSLDSEQSISAIGWAQQYLPWNSMKPSVSYLFEWIAPDNRIVVDYNNWRGLILLAGFNNDNGTEYSYKDIPILPNGNFKFLQPYEYSIEQLLDLAKSSKENIEGWVLKWNDGYRLKIKTDEYVRLHKLVTGITPNRVWEMLSTGADYAMVKESIPNEFYAEYDAIALPMIDAFNNIRGETLKIFESRDIMDNATRKDYALWVQKQKREYWSLLFMMLDNCSEEQLARVIWKIIKEKKCV